MRRTWTRKASSRTRGGGVDVVDGAAIDADGSENAGIFAGASQIVAHLAVLEKNRGPAIAAFDAAVKVVPLVDPADGRVRLLLLVDSCDALAAGNLAEQRKRSVQHSAIVGGCDHQTLRLAGTGESARRRTNLGLDDPISVRHQCLRRMQIGSDGVKRGKRCENNRVAACGRCGRQRTPEHLRHAASQFLTCGFQNNRIAKNEDPGWEAIEIPGLLRAQARVTEPGFGAGLRDKISGDKCQRQKNQTYVEYDSRLS